MAQKKDKILIVDDTQINRSNLITILSAEYDIVEACNGLKAIEYMGKYIQEISLVLLDINMPVMDGFEVLRIMSKNGWSQMLPVITITSETDSQTINRAYDLGVSDYINRPFNEAIVQRRVKNSILLYAKQKKLTDMVSEQILEKERTNLLMVEVLSHIVEFRNGESGLHILRIRIITDFVMKELTKMDISYQFTDSYISQVVNAAALHDIGKIMIPDEILNKPSKLSDEEYEIMKRHSALGAQMLENIPYYEHEELLQIAHDICRWHHERYDGHGYPDQLKGDEIPIIAQIVALADVYDALTSKRVYKPAFPHEKAKQMILNGECGAFHPLLLRCLQESGDRLKERLIEYNDEDFIRIEAQNIKGELLQNSGTFNHSLAMLAQEREKYQFFSSMAKEIQFEYDYKTHILTLSQWGAMYLCLPEIIVEPYLNTCLEDVFPEQAFQGLKQKLNFATIKEPIIESVYQIKVKGEARWFQVFVRPLWINEEHPEVTGIIGKCVDIHEEYIRQHPQEKPLAKDALSKLWNFNAARKQIQVVTEKNKGENYALLLLEIDNYKEAMKSYGDMFGNELLKYTARRLDDCVSQESLISLMGNGEFMVFMKYEGNVEAEISRIHKTVMGLYKGYQMTLSIGVALFPRDGERSDELFKHAEQALYFAKYAGRKQYRFYRAMRH